MRIADHSFERVKNNRGRLAALGFTLIILTSLFLIGCSELAKPTATAVDRHRGCVRSNARTARYSRTGARWGLSRRPRGIGTTRRTSRRRRKQRRTITHHVGLGCAACHSIADDVIVGPGWKGLYARAGERTDLEAEDYLVQSITKPSKFIAEGFTNVMPSFDYLSDQERTGRLDRLRQNERVGQQTRGTKIAARQSKVLACCGSADQRRLVLS